MSRQDFWNADWDQAHTYRGASLDQRLIPPRNIVSYLEHWAKSTPAAPFITEVNGTDATIFTYRDMWLLCVSAMSHIHTAVPAADRVGVITRNNSLTVAHILAALALGNSVVLVNRADPVSRIAAQLDALGCELVLDCCGDQPVPGALVVDGPMVPDESIESRPIASGGDRPALIFHTTGSTATSKPVLQSHYNVLVNSGALANLHGLSTRTLFGSLPICYANGLDLSVVATMIAGGHLVLADAFDPFSFWRNTSRYGCEIASVVPSMLDALGDARPGNVPIMLDYFISAASALQQTTAETVWRRYGLKVIQGYGLSETTNFSTSLAPTIGDRDYRRLVTEAEIPSVGVAVHGNEVCVVREDGSPAGEGEVGEVCMRGHNVMTEYINNPGATAAAFVGGLFHSGDLGYLRTVEGEPHLTLVGRQKNMVKVDGGAAVGLEEMERIVSRLPFVRECAAYSFSWRPGQVRIGLAVVADNRFATEGIEKELRKWFRGELLPSRIDLVVAIPRSANGKLLRKEMTSRLGLEGM